MKKFEPLKVVAFQTMNDEIATGILIKETYSEFLDEKEWAILYLKNDGAVEYDTVVAESWLRNNSSESEIVWDDVWKLREILHSKLQEIFSKPCSTIEEDE